MSIALVVTAGFGNGTLSGTIKGVVLRGYDIGTQVITPDSVFSVVGSIDGGGQSSTGIIDAAGLSITGLIFDTFSVSGTINGSGLSVTGIIDGTGISVTGLI